MKFDEAWKSVNKPRGLSLRGASMKVNVGDKAPDFTLQSQKGENVTLSQFQDKKNVVLYFYPKDETVGCTR